MAGKMRAFGDVYLASTQPRRRSGAVLDKAIAGCRADEFAEIRSGTESLGEEGETLRPRMGMAL